jgi:hypothetical protein
MNFTKTIPGLGMTTITTMAGDAPMVTTMIAPPAVLRGSLGEARERCLPRPGLA